MKSLFKSAILLVAFSMSFTTVSAQGFMKKLGKKVSKVTEVVAPSETQETAAAEDENVPDTKAFLDSIPSYTVQKYIVKDAEGNEVKNEDGTVQTRYFLVDQNGNVCAKNTAKKHLGTALKSGALILAKIGAGAAVGVMGGKAHGGAKSKLIGGLGGAALGALASADDIKEVKKQIKLMKECKKVLSAYEKTFTEEGELLDASVDLSDIDGVDFSECAELSKSAEEIKAEFQASSEEGGSLEDINLDELA